VALSPDGPVTVENPGPTADCPLCNRPGPGISRQRLFQHLDPLVMMDVLKWRDTSVCLNASCQCLYFSGGEWLSHLQCNKRVGFKGDSPPRVFCYCFGHKAEDLLKSGKKGKGRILKEIEAYLQGGGDACRITNPTGQPCLGPIRDYLERQNP
jgi:hypothetical protein